MRSGGKTFSVGSVGPAEAVGSAGHIVSPGFFETLGIRILDGRSCTEQDDERSVVVDSLYARRLYEGRSPVGLAMEDRVISQGRPGYRIIGLADRANLRGLEQRDGQPIFYMCDAIGHGTWEYSILLRSTRPAEGVVRDMRQALRSIDSRLAMSYAGSLDGELEAMLVERRAVTMLLGCMAGLALLLALTGIYAVLANDVVQRRREIGIRFALGARRQEIYALVVSSGMAKTLSGLVLGLGGAAALSRVLRGFLFDVSALDPRVFGAAIVVLAATALAACLAPAWRAAEASPTAVLREQ